MNGFVKFLFIYLVILVVLLIFSYNYLFEEGKLLASSEKDSCQYHPKNSPYECPYGKHHCKASSPFEMALCPLNKAIYDPVLSKNFDFTSIISNVNNLFNPIYFIPKKPSTTINVSYTKSRSIYTITTLYQEPQTIYIMDNSSKIRNIIGMSFNPETKENYIYAYYDFLINFIVEYNKNPINIYSLDNLYNIINSIYDKNDEKMKLENLSHLNLTSKQQNNKQLSEYLIFFEDPIGLKQLSNIISKSFLTKYEDYSKFDYYYYLKSQIYSSETLTFFEFIMYLSYIVKNNGNTDFTFNVISDF